MWPAAYHFPSLTTEQTKQTVVLLFYIDFGTSTLKLMYVFLTDTSAQKTEEFMILSETHLVNEMYWDISDVFGPITYEI